MTDMSIQVAVFVSLLFIIISSQPVYKITNKVVSKLTGIRLADAAGNATRVGLIMHALVMFGAVYLYTRANKI
jgi:hypothetical protein